MRRLSFVLIVLALAQACDTSRLTEITDARGRPSLATDGDFTDVALVVGNFIGGSSSNAILRYDGTGRFVDVMANLALPAGPRGGCCFAFGPDEHLYVTAGGGPGNPGRVNRFNGVTGEFIDEFVTVGSGGLMRPLVVVFGPDGHLYVGDIGSQSIRRYDGRTGAFIDHFLAPGSFGAVGPQLFTFGPDGHLYVVAPPPGLNAVRRFDVVTRQPIEDTFVAGSATEPVVSGLTFGPDGNLYVGVANGVNRYDGTTGALLGAFVAQGSGGLSVPVGMVFGPDGDFYVASPGSAGGGRVLRYDGVTGSLVDAFVPATEPHITGPRIIAFKSKITMCHQPPGRDGEGHSISIGYLHASDHVRHGDAVGACN